jgi:2-polyprenyl-3-methyl-5-hydroxy-6-metoxy-1,4-benzoquinol methylase
MNDKNFLEKLPRQKFDIIICLGTLYHLSNPDAALRLMCENTKELILSTCVSAKPGWNFVSENKNTIN